MKIGFIGAGKMAQALARGLINSGKHYWFQKLLISIANLGNCFYKSKA